MAVLGSGPAGFYTAYKVMSSIENATVDMYESLPVPFGLVRFGVAPDHPEVKVKCFLQNLDVLLIPCCPSCSHCSSLIFSYQNCRDRFEEVASSPRFTFIGNVAIGKDLPLADLRPHYNAIVFAYGATKDRKLGIPGEDSLKGIHSARDFVGWYNGLPEHEALAPDLESGEEALILGQGNVALDVARTLLSDVNSLRKTDMTEYALDTLSKSRVNRVRVIGRRGPMQVCSFISSTPKKFAHVTNFAGILYNQRSPRAVKVAFYLFRAYRSYSVPAKHHETSSHAQTSNSALS